MIMQTLRERTREHHQRIEGVIAIMSPTLTRERYIEILRKFLIFYRPIEQKLGAIFAAQCPEFDFVSRRKVPLLERDLAALGASPPAATATSPLPLTTLDEALGCIYVLEGSTLGAQLIIQHVQKTLGLDGKTGASYYYGYGASTGKQWQAMRQLITDKTDRADVVVQSACATFDALMG
jgi:heme oxygenase